MMPTQKEVTDEGDTLVPDEPIPEVDAELHDPAEFLQTVRGLVHGDQGDLRSEPAEDGRPEKAAEPAAVAEEHLGDWLPGLSLADDKPEPKRVRRAARRAARRADKQARMHELKQVRAERRNARASRKANRRVGAVVPAQAEPTVEVRLEQQRVPAQAEAREVVDAGISAPGELAEPAVSRRARRRQRRREAVRAVAVEGRFVDDEPATEVALVARSAATESGAARPTRAARRQERRQSAARAVAEAVPAVEPEPARAGTQAGAPTADSLDVDVPPAGGAGTELGEPVVATRLRGRAGRRQRRHDKALARTVARAVEKGESRDRAAEPEALADYLARVEAPLLPRRFRRSRPRTPLWLWRSVKIALVSAVVAGSVALPWAVPAVRDFLGDLVPDRSAPVTRVEDPPVSPSDEAFTGPVGISGQAGPLDGVRLEAAGWPREVRVQRLHVDSEVVPISGQSGSLLPPSDPQLLGWWREGKPVGAQYGTAVITGHTVHTGGGALDHLDRLVVGDSMQVRTDDGWIRYVVQRSRIYSTEELAREADNIFRLGGVGRLVMITCDDWNGEFYESNAVVVATPVLDEPFVSDSETEVPDAGPDS
jgi:LPXTG-site transpeptidase (sortase) family protein